MLWDLWQKDALGSVVRRKTSEVLWFSNEWQIAREDNQWEIGYRLRNFDNEVDVFFASESAKLTPAATKAFKQFLLEEFAYDLNGKKNEEV